MLHTTQWPIYFKNLLTVGNLDSEVSIVTLWTKRGDIEKNIDKNKYAVIGQLYSKDEGLNALVRNCLANKKIRHIIITGNDLNNSGEALTKLFENGLDKENKIIGIDHAYVDREITKRSLDDFRKNVKIHDFRSLKNFSKLNEIIASLPKLGSYGKPEIFSESKLDLPELLPSEKNGFIVREKYVGNAWLKIIKLIMKFGETKKSQYDIGQRELMDLMVIIEEEDTDKLKWREFYQFTKKDLEKYIPTVITPIVDPSIEYTYGQRLMKFRNIDQIKKIVQELKAHNFSRRAVACTWDIVKDINSDKPPCLDLVQCLVQGNKLYLTAYFRSNDMFEAWPRNVYALRKLQKIISEEIGIDMGTITTFSCSAHIYKNNWKKAKEIIEKYPIKVEKIGDPRGNFRISIERERIKVAHMTPEGKRIDEICGKTAEEICEKMVENFRINDQFHAFYLGKELQKAEIALKNGSEYVQDQGLKI